MMVRSTESDVPLEVSYLPIFRGVYLAIASCGIIPLGGAPSILAISAFTIVPTRF